MLKFFLSLFLLFNLCACSPASKENTLSETLKQEEKVHYDTQCISSQSDCEVEVNNAKYQVKFAQESLSQNIQSETPFVIELMQQSLNSQGQSENTIVSAHLEGVDMFMGKIPVKFTKVANSKAFIAESLLARCHGGKMDWRLWVTVSEEGEEQQFYVDFTTQD